MSGRPASPPGTLRAVRRRLDAELVRRGLVPSRARAAELIAAGRVRVAGAPADKPARQVGPDEPIVVQGEAARFASRGGATSGRPEVVETVK